jgi:hypothetical protein
METKTKDIGSNRRHVGLGALKPFQSAQIIPSNNQEFKQSIVILNSQGSLSRRLGTVIATGLQDQRPRLTDDPSSLSIIAGIPGVRPNQERLDVYRAKLIQSTKPFKLPQNSDHWLQFMAGVSAFNREKPHARSFF